jgi:hypothetical protein
MQKDPIVEEVRKAGEELFKQANYDLHTLFENIRKSQKERNIKVVSILKVESSNVVESVGFQDK